MINMSLCASAIRIDNWERVLISLRDNEIKYEVIFAGNVKPDFDLSTYPEFKYIYTEVKPAQAYEIAFRASQGEFIGWTADDTCFSPNALDSMYGFLKCFNDYRVVGAFRAIENGHEETATHHLIGRRKDTPVMAPFGVISRQLYNEIGGYDQDFICGQSENDLVMRAYEIGGRVEICNNAVAIAEHQRVHKGQTEFRQGYYGLDRQVLEKAWMDINGGVSKHRLIKFKPFEEKDLLTKTQGTIHGKW
jgi:hypothetical protein